MADPCRSVCGGVAAGGAASSGRLLVAGPHVVSLASGSARAAGEVFRQPAADFRAAGAAVAGHAGSEPGGDVRSGPLSGRSGGVRLHAHGFSEGDHWRPAVSAPGVSLHADVLELGIDHGVPVGVLRGAQRGAAERVVGIGRRAASAPQRQPHGGGEQSLRRAGVSAALPGALGILRSGGPADQRPPGARERGRGILTRAFQECGGPSPAIAWQPRLPEPRGVRAVPSRAGGPPQWESAAAVGGRAGGAA